MAYIDGVVIPILPGRIEEYRAHCAAMGQVTLEYGALSVVDCVGADDVPEGKQTDLWRAVAADKAGGESIGFSWVVWPSKAVRDEAWGKIMADGRMNPTPDMPIDMTRMIFGGFDVISEMKG